MSLRLANVTGPRLAIGPIPTFYKRLKAGQKCFCSRTVRDFIDMEDFLIDRRSGNAGHRADRNLQCLDRNRAHRERNFRHRRRPSRHCRWIRRSMRSIPVLTTFRAVVLDPSHTIATFGWKPRLRFRETILRMLAWYDMHGVTAIYSHLQQPASAKTIAAGRATMSDFSGRNISDRRRRRLRRLQSGEIHSETATAPADHRRQSLVGRSRQRAGRSGGSICRPAP